MNYLPRLVDAQLLDGLEASGLVLIEGPRGCGKTATAKQVAASVVQLDRSPAALDLARFSPETLLEGVHPRLIDEWQLAPGLWNEARHIVDETQKRGLYIFTGSATVIKTGALHPGSARFRKLRMRTMSVQETRTSTGEYGIRSLLYQDAIASVARIEQFNFQSLLDVMCIGGWPGYFGLTSHQALKFHKDYLHDVVNLDLQTTDGPSDPKSAQKILITLARTLGEKTPVSKIVDAISASGTPIKHQTVQAYIGQFENLHIIEEIPAWVPQLRSRYTVNQAAKRYFGDASLAISALSATPARLIGDVKTTGFIFENFVMSSLLTIAQVLNGEVRHYRDESGLEVDAIIENGEGEWGAIEIKLGFNSVEMAAQNLLKFAERVDTQATGEPAFLAVITNSDYSYQRNDGVHVISISHLGV